LFELGVESLVWLIEILADQGNVDEQ